MLNTPEASGQIRRSGTDMTERDCYTRALYHFQGLKACLRGLAALRMDARWLVPVQWLDRMEDVVKKAITQPGARQIILPYRTGRD